MFHILLISLLLSLGVQAEVKKIQNEKPLLASTVRQLFSHKKHEIVLKKLQVSCQDCHSFSIKSRDPGPLGAPVAMGLLKPNQNSCHQCHLEKVMVSTPSQCILCHQSGENLKPEDHNALWKQQHAQFARLDSQGCQDCHTQKSCSQCHFKRDQMNPMVHRGNFRLTHSIDARLNPASCVQCHQQQQFCQKCHDGSVR